MRIPPTSTNAADGKKGLGWKMKSKNSFSSCNGAVKWLGL
jgi:hypothetical protein